MAVNLTDIKYQTVYKQALPPALFEDDATGASLDFNNCVGTIYAIMNLATMTLGWEVNITIQESNDQGTWTAIN